MVEIKYDDISDDFNQQLIGTPDILTTVRVTNTCNPETVHGECAPETGNAGVGQDKTYTHNWSNIFKAGVTYKQKLSEWLLHANQTIKANKKIRSRNHI